MLPPASLNRLLRWLLLALLFPLICLNGWLSFKVVQFFQPLVTSLMLAALLAFLLNTPVYFLQKQGLRRPWAAAIVAAIAIVTLGSLGVTLVPALSDDVREVAQLVPAVARFGASAASSVENLAQHNRLPGGLESGGGRTERSPAAGNRVVCG
ncbi:MAG: AI-2E family transporter [Leptolyngbyaceae cyanobacterium SM1_3_5]|nr:AI-2E family transporter [Leptolyngbyaceae cyanobacterium SM1_3_5]